MTLRTHQRGDTIVEVMIVLAVLGSAIAIGYQTANRSLKSTRAAQENAYATSLLDSQVEEIRALTPGVVDIYQDHLRFCVDTKPAVSVAHRFGTAAYDANCTNIENLYTIDDYYNVATNTFTLKATWDDPLGSNVPSSVTTVYRVYK